MLGVMACHPPFEMGNRRIRVDELQRVPQLLQLAVAKNGLMYLGVSGTDLMPPTPMHADNIHEVGVRSELCCVGIHVMTVPAVRKGCEYGRDFGFVCA